MLAFAGTLSDSCFLTTPLPLPAAAHTLSSVTLEEEEKNNNTHTKRLLYLKRDAASNGQDSSSSCVSGLLHHRPEETSNVLCLHPSADCFPWRDRDALESGDWPLVVQLSVESILITPATAG